tara:strand:- start:393 stop:611 length:219 start_codon:yes stop_codon:yes gene_type:complete
MLREDLRELRGEDGVLIADYDPENSDSVRAAAVSLKMSEGRMRREDYVSHYAQLALDGYDPHKEFLVERGII